jgi:hypothetical protein
MFSMFNVVIKTKRGDVKFYTGPATKDRTVAFLEAEKIKGIYNNIFFGISRLNPKDTYDLGIGIKHAFKDLLVDLRKELCTYCGSNADKALYREIRDKIWKELIMAYPSAFSPEAVDRVKNKK